MNVLGFYWWLLNIASLISPKNLNLFSKGIKTLLRDSHETLTSHKLFKKPDYVAQVSSFPCKLSSCQSCLTLLRIRCGSHTYIYVHYSQKKLDLFQSIPRIFPYYGKYFHTMEFDFPTFFYDISKLFPYHGRGLIFQRQRKDWIGLKHKNFRPSLGRS